MQLYKVKLNSPETTAPEDNCNGYLGYSNDERNAPCIYTRGDALKKAIAFNGKIEKHGKNFTTATLKVLQLAKSEISQEVLNDLSGRETYNDLSDLDEPLYYGNVFDDILSVQFEMTEFFRHNQTILDELEILNELSNEYQYIMISSFN